MYDLFGRYPLKLHILGIPTKLYIKLHIKNNLHISSFVINVVDIFIKIN